MADSSSSSAPALSQAYTEAWLPGWDGLNFYTRTYTPSTGAPRAALLFVHGFAEYIGRYEWAHGVYAARGVAVFTFDQRGFGLTAMGDRAHVSKESKYGKTSWDAQFRDIEWWLKYVRDQFPGVPVFLMGHSMVRVLSCVCSWSVSEGTGFTRVVGWLLASRHVQSLHLPRTVSHSYRA